MVNAFNQCCAEKEPTGLDVGDAIREDSNGLDDLRCERGTEASRVAVSVASMKRVLADGQAQQVQSLYEVTCQHHTQPGMFGQGFSYYKNG